MSETSIRVGNPSILHIPREFTSFVSMVGVLKAIHGYPYMKMRKCDFRHFRPSILNKNHLFVENRIKSLFKLSYGTFQAIIRNL